MTIYTYGTMHDPLQIWNKLCLFTHIVQCMTVKVSTHTEKCMTLYTHGTKHTSLHTQDNHASLHTQVNACIFAHTHTQDNASLFAHQYTIPRCWAHEAAGPGTP